MAYVTKTERTVEEIEPKDAEAVPTEVERDEDTGKVVTVKLDEKVSADSDKAVQIPPQADASSVDGAGVHDEPTPLEAVAEDDSVNAADPVDANDE